jgi:hypothetical protein
MKRSIPFIANTLLFRPALISAAALPLVIATVQGDTSNSEMPDPAPQQEAATSAHDFVNSIGVNTHLNYFDRTYENFLLVRRELESIGILHVRDGIHLQDSAYNQALYARWVQLAKIGIRFDAVLDPRSNLPPLTAPLLEEMNALAGHAIESFEGPNELDVSNVNNWPSVARNYQAAIFNSTKAITVKEPIRVVGLSLAFARHGSAVGDISDLTDVINLHPYPAAKMPSAIFPEQTDLAKLMSPHKQIVFTETGYHNALNDHRDQPAISEIAAAKYIPRLLLENFARGITRTYLYEFLDEATDSGLKDNQLHWGLIRADGSEKPAFVALKNLIAVLNDATEPAYPKQLTWSLSSKNSQIHHLLLQKSNGNFDLVLWQEVTSYDYRRQKNVVVRKEDVALSLGRKARSVTLYEPSLQGAPLGVLTDVTRVALEIPDSPVVIEISQ